MVAFAKVVEFDATLGEYGLIEVVRNFDAFRCDSHGHISVGSSETTATTLGVLTANMKLCGFHLLPLYHRYIYFVKRATKNFYVGKSTYTHEDLIEFAHALLAAEQRRSQTEE